MKGDSAMKRLSAFSASALLMALVLAPVPAWAHNMWVNAYDSFAHPPGHVLASVGFGHRQPQDDLLTTDFGTIRLATYELATPSGKRLALPMPDYTRHREPADAGLFMERGDIGVTKVSFGPESEEGVYVLGAETVPTHVCKYVNTKGRQSAALKAMDEIGDVREIIFSVMYSGYAKSMFSYGTSGIPEPLGHDLEINPQVDVAALRPGDLLPVEVTFMGKPLSCEGTDLVYVTAVSDTYGGPDGYMLMAYVMDGKARIRIPTAGRWMLAVFTMRDVEKDPTLADLRGKVLEAGYQATLTLEVKP